jgi:hypothetical protein
MWLSGSYRVVGQSQGPLSLGHRAVDHRRARQRKSTVIPSADVVNLIATPDDISATLIEKAFPQSPSPLSPDDKPRPPLPDPNCQFCCQLTQTYSDFLFTHFLSGTSFHGRGPRSRRLVENNYQRERTHIINAPDNELHHA